VTPLDREDIALLAHSLDDVVDFIEAQRMLGLYKIEKPTVGSQGAGRDNCTDNQGDISGHLRVAPPYRLKKDIAAQCRN